MIRALCKKKRTKSAEAEEVTPPNRESSPLEDSSTQTRGLRIGANEAAAAGAQKLLEQVSPLLNLAIVMSRN